MTAKPGGDEVTPDVSVIIPAHNSVNDIERCITSVLGQSIGLDRLEIIVIDDASTDGTGEILTRMAEGDEHMRLVRLGGTGGPAIPRNAGLDLARGRFVYFLDHDDYLGEEALERLVAMADENGSDIVLGKMVGVAGRHAPQSMFTRDQPNAGLFTSKVYWTLNPMKLFRREMIERIGLRFLNLPWGEDQPFVAEAYLNASVISVLASYDCIYWCQRADGANLMRSTPSLASRLTCPDVMFPLIARYVPPGPDRDLLARRHFEVGVMNVVLTALADEKDPDLQREGFATVRGWVRDYYTAGIAKKLRPWHRVAYDLVQRDRLPELVEYMHLTRAKKDWPEVVRHGHVYLTLPYFRDPAVGVPEECYRLRLATLPLYAPRRLARGVWRRLRRLAGRS